MSLDIAQIDHLARLARLKLTDQEKELYASQLANVFDYFQKLQTVDTTGVEPMSQIIPLKNVFRADEPAVDTEETHQKIITNAPNKSGRHLVVKKIL
ncbi:Asp-tRNA(Asn)/Glu-tRNA(Gln) amidotransferase subunit GatC [Candidatus Kuenenbacteria bacterium]|nr:Asp-tRNA(Asn)/Glu-tRNA(Gln) amidotransferase subunit GatC [Candidatus Kuenenbacteria bacterium]